MPIATKKVNNHPSNQNERGRWAMDVQCCCSYPLGGEDRPPAYRTRAVEPFVVGEGVEVVVLGISLDLVACAHLNQSRFVLRLYMLDFVVHVLL